MTYNGIDPKGSLTARALRNGYLVTLLLIGYTKREALRIFHDECAND